MSFMSEQFGCRMHLAGQISEPPDDRLSFDRRLPAPMHSLDAEGRILDVSDDWLALLGYERDEVVGRPVFDFLSDGSVRHFKEVAWHDFNAAGEARGVERQFTRKDGRVVDALVSARVVRDAAGHLIGTRSVLTDITERKRAAMELRRSEHARLAQAERQSAILDALPAHVALLDASGCITHVNRAWREFAGQGSYAGGIGTDYCAVCDAAAGYGDPEAGEVAAGLRALLAGTRDHYETEYRCLTPAGERWFQMIAVPQSRERNGGLVVVHTDVTQIKQAQEALRREKKFSERILASIGEGIVAYDCEARIRVWNAAMERQLRISSDQVLGRGMFDVFPSLRGGVIEAAVRGAIAGRDTTIPETASMAAEVSHVEYFEAHHSPLYGEAGEIIGGVGFVRDTTQRHQMEEQLRHAQRMEAVGELTSNIAHDFNNILSAIVGSLDLLKAGLAGQPSLLRRVGAAEVAAGRAERLIRQLLTFARRQPLQPRAADVNAIIEEIGALLDSTAGSQIPVQREPADNLWPVMLDHQQFEAALLNLVANARDAMPEGGTITLRTTNAVLGGDGRHGDVPPGDYVTVVVADTGLGIPPDVLPRIFEPFFTTKPPGRGTGLGLSSVHGFVHQSGGHIDVESAVGQGTVITLYFPRAAALG